MQNRTEAHTETLKPLPAGRYVFMSCRRPDLHLYGEATERDLGGDVVELTAWTPRGWRTWRCHHRGSRRERWEVLRRKAVSRVRDAGSGDRYSNPGSRTPKELL